MELQSNYKKNQRKIILTEKVYIRLLGMANMTGFSMNMLSKEEVNAGLEYVVVLYGKTDKDGNIIFSETDNADYEEQDGYSIISSELRDDIITNLIKPEFNCCAFIHTHPYGKTESSRVFSDEDISYYKKNFRSSLYSKVFKKGIINLFGMISVSELNIPEQDDISFIYYNEEADRMEYLPNVYVNINEKLIPLRNQTEIVYFDSTNHIYNEHQLKDNERYTHTNINRTYLEVLDDEEPKSR